MKESGTGSRYLLQAGILLMLATLLAMQGEPPQKKKTLQSNLKGMVRDLADRPGYMYIVPQKSWKYLSMRIRSSPPPA